MHQIGMGDDDPIFNLLDQEVFDHNEFLGVSKNSDGRYVFLTKSGRFYMYILSDKIEVVDWNRETKITKESDTYVVIATSGFATEIGDKDILNSFILYQLNVAESYTNSFKNDLRAVNKHIS